jgi:hypothetical protein
MRRELPRISSLPPLVRGLFLTFSAASIFFSFAISASMIPTARASLPLWKAAIHSLGRNSGRGS